MSTMLTLKKHHNYHALARASITRSSPTCHKKRFLRRAKLVPNSPKNPRHPLSIQVNSSNLSEQNLGGTWIWLKIQMLLRDPLKSPKYPQISVLQKILDTSYLVTLPRSLKILGNIRLGFSKRENNLRYDHDRL